VRFTSQDDLNKVSAVDEACPVEEFVVLLLSSILIGRGWRVVRAILVDFCKFLNNVLQWILSVIFQENTQKQVYIVMPAQENQKCTRGRRHQKKPPVCKYVVPKPARAILATN
jgi:hypothetical protein